MSLYRRLLAIKKSSSAESAFEYELCSVLPSAYTGTVDNVVHSRIPSASFEDLVVYRLVNFSTVGWFDKVPVSRNVGFIENVVGRHRKDFAIEGRKVETSAGSKWSGDRPVTVK